jgi:hypothetical protein
MSLSKKERTERPLLCVVYLDGRKNNVEFFEEGKYEGVLEEKLGHVSRIARRFKTAKEAILWAQDTIEDQEQRETWKISKKHYKIAYYDCEAQDVLVKDFVTYEEMKAFTQDKSCYVVAYTRKRRRKAVEKIEYAAKQLKEKRKQIEKAKKSILITGYHVKDPIKREFNFWMSEYMYENGGCKPGNIVKTGKKQRNGLIVTDVREWQEKMFVPEKCAMRVIEAKE